MVQDVEFFNLDLSPTIDTLVALSHKKCGEWYDVFATIVANAKILLDIGLDSWSPSLLFMIMKDLMTKL